MAAIVGANLNIVNMLATESAKDKFYFQNHVLTTQTIKRYHLEQVLCLLLCISRHFGRHLEHRYHYGLLKLQTVCSAFKAKYFNTKPIKK